MTIQQIVQNLNKSEQMREANASVYTSENLDGETVINYRVVRYADSVQFLQPEVGIDTAVIATIGKDGELRLDTSSKFEGDLNYKAVRNFVSYHYEQ